MLQLDVAPACVQRAGGDRGVTLFERRRDRAWNNAISCDAILRVEKLHLLFQQTDPCHAGHFGGASDGSLDALSEVVEFAVRILCSRVLPQRVAHPRAGGDDNRFPNVGVKVCALRESIPQSRDRAWKVRSSRNARDQHETVAIGEHRRDLELRANLRTHQFRRFAQERVVERPCAAQNDIDR